MSILTIIYNSSLLYLLFSCILAINNFLLVWIKNTLLVIASLAIFKVLYRKVNLSKSSIWYQNNDISFSISVTYFIFPDISGITLKLNQVYISILKVASILLLLKADILFLYIENFWNIIAKLYSISSITRHANFIFWDIIS